MNKLTNKSLENLPYSQPTKPDRRHNALSGLKRFTGWISDKHKSETIGERDYKQETTCVIGVITVFFFVLLPR